MIEDRYALAVPFGRVIEDTRGGMPLQATTILPRICSFFPHTGSILTSPSPWSMTEGGANLSLSLIIGELFVF